MKRMAREGFTLVEIMIVVAIIALLAAIAIPNVLRGRTSANEAAAIGDLRALNSSLQMFQSVNGTFPTAAGWVASMYPGGGVPNYGPNAFNNAVVGTGTGYVVQGYRYLYTALPAACTALQAAPCSDYTITANPQTVNTTGTRAFFTSSSAEMRHVTGAGPATATCPTVDLPPGAAGC